MARGRRPPRHSAVHLYGQCADFTSFARIAKERNLKLIEDAAQAWEPSGKGSKPVRSVTPRLSFLSTKNLSAAGDAGMATTNSDEIAERARMLRQHGMRRRYYHDEIGWNTRMDGFQGAILTSSSSTSTDGTSFAAPSPVAITPSFTRGLVEAGPYPAHGVVLPHEVPGTITSGTIRHPHQPPRRPAPVPH